MVRLILSLSLLLPALAGVAMAQPTEPDLAQAAAMYRSAEQAMTQGNYEDAARDYGAAYEISKDAVLFFKIGAALDKAGKCPVAMTYYRRYLREGKPSADFQRLTTERIAACEAAAKAAGGADPGRGEATPPETGPATAGPSDPPSDDVGAGSGEPAVEDPPAPPPSADPVIDAIPPPAPRRTAAWISVGTGIAFATAGAVFALSAESTENDISDLYLVRPGGEPLPFDAATQKRYQDLVDRGDLYQTLSWASLGLAGAAAVTATYLFLTSSSSSEATKPVALRPLISPTAAGVGAAWSW
jgi:tetratricopeptide (TPR) repeat protein